MIVIDVGFLEVEDSDRIELETVVDTEGEKTEGTFVVQPAQGTLVVIVGACESGIVVDSVVGIVEVEESVEDVEPLPVAATSENQFQPPTGQYTVQLF